MQNNGQVGGECQEEVCFSGVDQHIDKSAWMITKQLGVACITGSDE